VKSHQFRRHALLLCLAACVTSLALCGQALANPGEGGPTLTAYQCSSGNLCLWETSEEANKVYHEALAMRSGTSPAITGIEETVPQYFATSFQSSTKTLYQFNNFESPINSGDEMAAGTSPAIAENGKRHYVSAFQANTGNLYMWTPETGPINTGDGMAAGTNPSITSGWAVAFQSNTGKVCLNVNFTLFCYQLGMAAGTSPSIAITPGGGGYTVAFQAAGSGDLWLLSTANGGSTINTGLGMAAGTSPSIADRGGTGGYEVAFQANTGNMNTYASISGWHNYGLGMKAGTSPSISYRGFGLTQVSFQANTGHLFTFVPQSGKSVDTGQPMAAGTSPSVAPFE